MRAEAGWAGSSSASAGGGGIERNFPGGVGWNDDMGWEE